MIGLIGKIPIETLGKQEDVGYKSQRSWDSRNSWLVLVQIRHNEMNIQPTKVWTPVF